MVLIIITFAIMITIIRIRELQSRKNLKKLNNKIISLSSLTTDVIGDLKGENKPKEDIGYEDWEKANKELILNTPNDASFNLFWRDQLAAKYLVMEIRKACVYPKLLQSFIHTLCSFNFNEVAAYMDTNDWYWSDNKRSPYVLELIDCCFELFSSCINAKNIQSRNNTVCSGGFAVTAYFDEKGIPHTDISFNALQ